jgi:hypothetical protein
VRLRRAQSVEVDRITGVRLVPLEGQKAMRVEYRIKWKDDVADTWCVARARGCFVRLCLPRRRPPYLSAAGVADAAAPRREPARNLAEDVLREFESRWWAAARKGELQELTDMLAGGREVLATTVDDNGRTCARACQPVPLGVPRQDSNADACVARCRPAAARSALHFACGIGSEPCVQLLLDNGADVSAGVRTPSATPAAPAALRHAHALTCHTLAPSVLAAPLRTRRIRRATRRCTSRLAT